MADDPEAVDQLGKLSILKEVGIPELSGASDAERLRITALAVCSERHDEPPPVRDRLLPYRLLDDMCANL